MRFRNALLIGVICLMSANAEAQELNDDQQTAKTIFENDLMDAREKLKEVKVGNPDSKIDWYIEWVVEPLKKSVAEARRVKVPPSTPIGAYDPIPFSKAALEAEGFEKEFRAAFGQKDDKIQHFKNGQTPENLRRYEEFKARFTKGLSGDKLRLMNEEVLIEAVVYAQDPPKFFVGYYGEGRKLLTRPEDFASARIWATDDYNYASDDTLKRDPHWRFHAYHFDGMKKVHESESHGSGKASPESLFKFRAN